MANYFDRTSKLIVVFIGKATREECVRMHVLHDQSS